MKEGGGRLVAAPHEGHVPAAYLLSVPFYTAGGALGHLRGFFFWLLSFLLKPVSNCSPFETRLRLPQPKIYLALGAGLYKYYVEVQGEINPFLSCAGQLRYLVE